ncbi:MAG TPA: multicopper oxidase domain-containing protein [Blastocatellia bacterium]|jgi:FtsP/CotA-like multicopper oxidase with cupredoxin domain
MAEDDDVKIRDAEQALTAAKGQKAFAARRKFLRQALAATSGVALAELFPSSLSLANLQQVQCTKGQPLIPIGEITSNGTQLYGNRLQAVLRVVNSNRAVPTSVSASKQTMLRYYSGYNPYKSGQMWPPPGRTAPGPGPTFRCSIGDVVEITFLNQVDVGRYPRSAFSGQEGTETGCDQGTTNTDPKWYPQSTGDTFPNCFHASSAANVHFHGTHVSPSTTGDNVIVNVWPDPKVKESDVKAAFDAVFAQGQQGNFPQKWRDLPVSWRNAQMGPEATWPNGPDKGLVGKFDATAPYKGGRGLPANLQLWPVDYAQVQKNQWPQYYVGSYPICFKIPRYDGSPTGVKMGQAPGTHWYHSHKHGSTSINLFNGLSGAFIIEDNDPNSRYAYDGKLKAFYRGNLKQLVLFFQQITSTINLLTAGAGAAPVLVNGQFTPTITMRPGEVQLWRMINACVQRALTFQFASCNTGDPPPQFKQTAQDGVQFHPLNYQIQPLTQNNSINMAPANRIDALVQAPMKLGTYTLGPTNAPIAFIQVTGTAMQMGFPSTADFPEMPPFLNTITDAEIKRPLQPPPATCKVTQPTDIPTRIICYGWEKGRQTPFRTGAGAAPHYTIDGKQFEDNHVDQTMTLDTAEEWLIVNQTTVAHPFHIHVNPFQIVEVFDPNTMTKPVRIVVDRADADAARAKWGDSKTYVAGPRVWWDNFALPLAQKSGNQMILGPDGFAATPGYFIMRSRFVDFTGLYVQHCHILAHEDRGMMQLLQVCRDPNSQECKNQASEVKHH